MTNAEARFNKSLHPRKPEGSLGRTAQDVHLDSHTAPELWDSARREDSLSACRPDPAVFRLRAREHVDTALVTLATNVWHPCTLRLELIFLCVSLIKSEITRQWSEELKFQ